MTMRANLLPQIAIFFPAGIAARPTASALCNQSAPPSFGSAFHAGRSTFEGDACSLRTVENGTRAGTKCRALGLGLARAFFAAFALFASPSACTSGCEETMEEAGNAGVVAEQYEKLMDVKKYIDENRGELEELTRGDGIAILRRAGRLSNLLEEMTLQMRVATVSVGLVETTGIKFNSNLFHDLNEAIDKSLQRVNPGTESIAKLHELAQDVRESRDGWGFTIRGLKKRGIAPQSVINLSNQVKSIRKALIDFKAGVKKISSNDVEGYSTNDFVNMRLKDVFGECFPGPKMIDDFARVKAGSDEKAVWELQKFLNERGLLDAEPDGNYGKATRIAHGRAKASIAAYCFMAAIRDCSIDDTPIGPRHKYIKAVQRVLINRGYLPPGSDDGKLGRRTYNATENAGEEVLHQVDQDCYKLEKMIFHSPEELDEITFDFGIAFGYMPPDIRDRSRSEQRCYAQAMARSKSFKNLMARDWE